MVNINSYYSDFLSSIDNIVLSKESSIVEINIINEIISLINNPTHYYLPQHTEDFNFTSKDINDINIDSTFIIETEIESYELLSKNTKVKTFTPTIYLCIKEKNKNFENLNLLTNSKIKIRDNLILVVRKHNGRWQIPPLAFNILENRFYPIEIFKTKYFDFQQNQLSINIQECIKIILIGTHKLYKNKISIIKNKQVDLIFHEINNINYQIPSFLLTKMNEISTNIQILRMEQDNIYKGALDDLYYYGVNL